MVKVYSIIVAIVAFLTIGTLIFSGANDYNGQPIVSVIDLLRLIGLLLLMILIGIVALVDYMKCFLESKKSKKEAA